MLKMIWGERRMRKKNKREIKRAATGVQGTTAGVKEAV